MCGQNPERSSSEWRERRLALVPIRPGAYVNGSLYHRDPLPQKDEISGLHLRRKPWQVVKFHNGRGTAEQWIKEGKNAVKWTKLSCHDFVDNQSRLQLFALAYNLGNFLRRLALPRSVKHWPLTRKKPGLPTKTPRE